eukprot:GAHX01005688.1.p1 GENE.GAHX01005688.1~~GAHX01005688.1.p1  ORF type:complete len:81 (-),score=0.78 GAHX01005688.1:126-368(-)
MSIFVSIDILFMYNDVPILLSIYFPKEQTQYSITLCIYKCFGVFVICWYCLAFLLYKYGMREGDFGVVLKIQRHIATCRN